MSKGPIRIKKKHFRSVVVNLYIIVQENEI